jgi:hypothetical protein
MNRDEVPFRVIAPLTTAVVRFARIKISPLPLKLEGFVPVPFCSDHQVVRL